MEVRLETRPDSMSLTLPQTVRRRLPMRLIYEALRVSRSIASLHAPPGLAHALSQPVLCIKISISYRL